MTDFDAKIADYRKSLVEAEAKVQSNYDKAVMTLSGGALGISLTFLKDVAAARPLALKEALLIAWIAWGMSITATLMSFFTSQRAFHKAVAQVDERSIYVVHPGGWYDRFTVVLNPLAGVLFLVGLIALVVFVSKNLP